MKSLSNLLDCFQLRYPEMLKELFKFTAPKSVIQQYTGEPIESTDNIYLKKKPKTPQKQNKKQKKSL